MGEIIRVSQSAQNGEVVNECTDMSATVPDLNASGLKHR